MFTKTAFDVYKKAVRTRFDTYTYPNWLPNAPVSLGDYGRFLPNGTFQRLGNLTELGIAFQTLDGPKKSALTFSTAKEVTVKPTLNLSGHEPHTVEIHSAATIKLTSRYAVFLKANGVQEVRIKDYQEVGSLLISRQNANLWHPSYVVVTKLHRAARGTIAIANSSRAGGEVDFQISGQLPISEVADLLAAETTLTIQKSRNVSFAGHFEAANFLLEFSQLKHVPFSFSTQPTVFVPRPNRGGVFGGLDQEAVHIYPQALGYRTGTTTYLMLAQVAIP